MPHTVAVERTCCRWPNGPASWCRSVAAASGGPSRWPTPVWAARPTPRRRCGPRSSTSNPREDAPVHRHTQHAFRFVVEGEGVWTVVDGDPVAMRRGDFLLTPGWRFHGHHNQSDAPMAWLDGLDIPFVHQTGLGVLRVRTRRGLRPFDAGPVPRRTAVGPPRPAAGLRSRASTAELADRRLPLGAHRRRADRPARARGRRGIPASSSRARRGPVHQPHHRRRRHADHPRRDAPPACRAPPPPRAARSARRSGRCSTAAAHVRVGDQSGRSARGDLFVVPSWLPLDHHRRRGARPLPVQRHPDLRAPARRPHPGGRNRPSVKADDTPDPRQRARGRPAPSASTGRRRRRRPRCRRRRRAARRPGLARARRRRRRAHVTPGDDADFAPLVPAPGKDLLRRAELPHPHPRDGPRAARSTRRCSRSSPRRSSARTTPSSRPRVATQVDWEAELAVVVGAPVRRATDARGRGGDRRLRRAQRRHHARLAVPHPAVAAGQDVRGHHAARPAAGHARRAARRHGRRPST